jgi:uncharacterized protein YndB with AHSA1/START domain
MSSTRGVLLLAGAATLCGPARAGDPGRLWDGKARTDRTVVVEATLDAAPRKVFEAWTTPEGLESFFAPRAVVEPRLGGAYTIVFDPEGDPEGLSKGTKGARILRFEPDRALAFEWITFIAQAGLGPELPPYLPPAQRNARPLPTWVEIALEPLPEGRTHLTLSHYGFRRGGAWEAAYPYFTSAWARVVARLVTVLR